MEVGMSFDEGEEPEAKEPAAHEPPPRRRTAGQQASPEEKAAAAGKCRPARRAELRV
jgi:hypothetical protein